MKVAAYQAPLLEPGSMEALDLIRMQVERCAADGIAFLCCPEAILGGLADYADDPRRFAITARLLDSVLAPIASDIVTTIVGFTELADEGVLYNSAAVFHRGSVAGVYRKLHPAINRSVYAAGHNVPVFQVSALKFGIVICNDSNNSELARLISARGATALFVPTNNGLPPTKGGADLVARTMAVDLAAAVDNRLWVIRADVAGRTRDLVSHGTSGIVAANGTVTRSARPQTADLLVSELCVVRS